MSEYAKRCDRCGYVYPPQRLRVLGGIPVRYRCRDVVRCNKNIAKREADLRAVGKRRPESNWCSSAERLVHVRGAH